jgi:hypothetical protein
MKNTEVLKVIHFYNINVDLMQLCAFVDLQHNS